jgi:hypothetical protein
MKTTIWITTVSVILIAITLGSIFYFKFLTDPPQLDPLVVNNLKAQTDGQISFNVTLNDYESSTIEGVVVNGQRYSWSHGSKEDSTILKGETKQWSIDIGTIEKDNEIQIVLEANALSVSSNTTVETSTSNGSIPKDSNYVYDFYGGVDLFIEGIHAIATSQDPRTLFGEYDTINDFWKMLLENKTTQATEQDFISIILSRGDKTTGGYKIQIENFSWLESYPVKFLFQVNFTDPGEDVATTDALTNPLVLVPIGKLTPGEYNIEVPILQYIQNFDENGNPSYTQILTFAPVIWEQKLTINTSPNTEGFGIFFTENNELVISEKEIIFYNTSSHEIILTEEGSRRIKNLSLNLPMDGKSFVLRINDKEIYRGWFWSPISSIPCSEIVIQTNVRDNTIQIITGYPQSNFQGEDPRNNPTLLNYFMSIGKLED